MTNTIKSYIKRNELSRAHITSIIVCCHSRCDKVSLGELGIGIGDNKRQTNILYGGMSMMTEICMAGKRIMGRTSTFSNSYR